MARGKQRQITDWVRKGPALDTDRSYRPRSPSPRRLPPPPDRDRYAHSHAPSRNHRESDSWRPGDRRRDHSPRSHRDDFSSRHDSYRPRPPQGDFTFRVDKPAGIPDFPVNYPPRQERGSQRGRGRGQARRGGRRWQPPPHPSERALVSGVTANLPEERLGDLDASHKFRDLDELSDDDELDMDISSSEEKSDSEGPSKKRARTTAGTESGDAAPKWSNPDPYTALPCPDETTRKKRDVVKLIRKARVEENAKPTAPTEAEDFISFDLTEDEDEEESVIEAPQPPREPAPPPPPNAPTGPRSARGKQPATSVEQPGATKNIPLPAPDRSGPLGSRKRTVDDEIKPPDYGQLRKANMKASKGSVIPMFQPKQGEEQCPWATVDHTATTDMAFR